jgi:hypothetical protein
MKKILILSFLYLNVSLLYAQERADSRESLEGASALQKNSIETAKDTGWFVGGNMALNFSQVQLNNWISGGQNSISATAFANLFANYHFGKVSWDNSLNLGYGQMKQDKATFFKTDDKIDFVSKYGRTAFGNWNYSGLFNFRSQFDVGYKSPTEKTVVSRFMAPAYIIGAIGMDYKPNQTISAFISPLTGKNTIVRDTALSNSGAYGVDPGQFVRYEVGGFLRLFFQKDVIKNVNVMSTVDLFSNYLHNPQNIDINWQVLVNMKVNKALSASVTTHLIYDDDVMIPIDRNVDGINEGKGPRTQFKEVLGVGLSYKF